MVMALMSQQHGTDQQRCLRWAVFYVALRYICLRCRTAQLMRSDSWPVRSTTKSFFACLCVGTCAQSNIESGHVGARVKRWARCLERSCALGQSALLEQAAAMADEDDDDSLPHPPPNGSATWQELLRRYVEHSAHLFVSG